MNAERGCIYGLTPHTLKAWLEEQGAPAYRAAQVLQWLYQCWVASFDEMSNLSKDLRARMAECFAFPVLRQADCQVSADRQTQKFLFELHDGEQIETVAMEDDGRTTFCVSSQAGCKLGCAFCATGRHPFGRDLTTGEILGQVAALARGCGALRNIVFMGMGEPLMNLDAVLPALEALNDPERFALGARRLTVSTAGIPSGIRRLAESPVHPHLALSLNSPFGEERSTIMPANRRHPLDEVLQACDDYARATGGRVLLEYVLLEGVNMTPRHALALAQIARRLGALVNLIPFNPVPDTGFEPPERDAVYAFRAAVERHGVAVTVRFRRGREIVAGCGQLKGRRRPKE